ncbi:MAG: TIGR02921 family PEP-CTERM protein [Cyanothece sp. SIO1E1]|nr:TIGR02921 family PEP-CTERM protein [Cyanothece sp. SIO1E1]
MKPSTPSKPKTRSLFAIFFWLFNLSLLLVLTVGFLPFMGMAILNDAARGEVPLSILVPVFGLVGVPTTSTIMGLRRKQRLKNLKELQPKSPFEPAPQRQPISLFQIFFGIEAPLLMACTIRLFFLRDLTSASSFLFISLALGTIAWVHWLLHGHNCEPESANWGHLAGLTIMLVLSLYLSVIALFYILPIFMTIGITLIHSIFLIVVLPLLLPFIILFSGLASMPWGMTLLFFKSWRQKLKQLSSRYRNGWPHAVVGIVLAVWLGLLLLLQQQPQTQAFALLDKKPQSEGDRQALLQKSEVIRKGLLNAYLGAYRYPLLGNGAIYKVYRKYLGFSNTTATKIQSAYNAVLTPFAYQGTGFDKGKAAQLYAEFFDTPILRGERDAIQTAVRSNFNRTEAKAGLLDINAERVKLQQQEITVTPQGDWAEVELHEVYANTTVEETEILYYFSLPESATITGLWLGETGDRAQRYEYTVAPRGAAQQVYTDQVQRRVDPALLEQVGPRNYRLRAFPIPPAGRDSLPRDGKPDTMHLWMTYKVMKQHDQWMLPVLNEQRNIFWTRSTKRMINGKPRRGNQAWLPPSIPANSAKSVTHQSVQVELPGGYIVANPLEARDYQLPEGKRFAFILDRSYSMNAHRKEIENSVQWLRDNLLDTNKADLYLTTAGATQAQKISSLETFDPTQVLFYGSLQIRQMLNQYQQAIAADVQHYDAIILITDSGSYELTQDGSPVPLSAPLWLVHLGGLQAAYDDATLETIQRTGGNTTPDIQTGMTRIATQPSLGPGTSLLNVVDGYAWFLSQTPYPTAHTAGEMAPIAARQWITQVSQAVKPDQLNQLDAIHQVAKDNSIVTPYSSMLVLVNSQQEQQLKEAETKSDRFNREIEDPQLPNPQGTILPVSAVPEPAGWLLLIAGLAMLSLWYRQKAIALPYVSSKLNDWQLP